MSKLNQLIDKYLIWSSVPTPFYKFWDWRSGPIGGLLFGCSLTIITLLLRLIIRVL